MDKSKPHIILSGAISIDGKIATKTNDSKLSSHKDIQRLHKLRTSVDAILVGKNTVLRDNPLLTVRHVKGKNPIRIILDSKETIIPDIYAGKILTNSPNFALSKFLLCS